MQYGATDLPVYQAKKKIRPGGKSRTKDKTYAFFRHWAGDSRALHFSLGVDDNTGVVLDM